MSTDPQISPTYPSSSPSMNAADISDATNRQPRRRGGRGRGRGRRGPDAGKDGENTNPESGAGTTNQRTNNARRRGRGGGHKQQSTQPSIDAAPSSPRTEQALEFIADSLADVSISNTDKNDKQRADNPRQHQRKGNKNNNDSGSTDTRNVKNQSHDTSTQPSEVNKKKKRRNRNRRRNKMTESRPWLSAIPPGTVDPISLDPLDELAYPPFALVMDEPYTPIYPGMWPPCDMEETDEKKEADKSDAEKDREVSILKAQWGEGVVPKERAEDAKKNGTRSAAADSTSVSCRQFYLFDGYVLAGYLTRTKQFINPYNRRDLTRPELEALDTYMNVHKLGNAGVVQAYDEKGVTLSTAGVAGQTAEGRAQIRQQEASAIRNAFFGADRQSQQSRRQQQQNYRTRDQDNYRQNGGFAAVQEQVVTDSGIYAEEEGGFLMIDDDINPGLRSGVPNHDAGSTYSGQRIAEQHSQQAQAREENFPSLATSAPAASTSNSVTNKPPAEPSKSLKSITKVVKKTDPAEIARQKKAREEAQRKAELSRLSFFDPSNPQPTSTNNGLLTAPSPMGKLPPTEALLERNRNLASALGVVPSQMRNGPMLTGWARPTTADIQLDHFGNEINATEYPDSLLLQAKERMAELLKLERTWKKFLADDKEASCSLKPMDRPTRVFVHEYSDFWRLKTQSYDPEGRRYIHCSKLVDTSTPHPLLSDAAKKWRGPVPGAPVPYQAPPSLKAAPASKSISKDTEGWHTEQRVPLKLAPRSVPDQSPHLAISGVGITRSTSSQALLTMTGEKPAPPRFADLHEERPKLQLMPRTIPPSEESLKLAAHAERQHKKEEARMHRHEDRKRKEHAEEQKKRAILESAFASDDEDEGSSGSDWFEGDAAWSDDEGM